jgi:hypothetical protein
MRSWMNRRSRPARRLTTRATSACSISEYAHQSHAAYWRSRRPVLKQNPSIIFLLSNSVIPGVADRFILHLRFRVTYGFDYSTRAEQTPKTINIVNYLFNFAQVVPGFDAEQVLRLPARNTSVRS